MFLAMLRSCMCLNERVFGGGWEMEREIGRESEREREREIII